MGFSKQICDEGFSFPIYVNMSHLCLGVCVVVAVSLFGSLVVFGLGRNVVGLRKYCCTRCYG